MLIIPLYMLSHSIVTTASLGIYSYLPIAGEDSGFRDPVFGPRAHGH